MPIAGEGEGAVVVVELVVVPSMVVASAFVAMAALVPSGVRVSSRWCRLVASVAA